MKRRWPNRKRRNANMVSAMLVLTAAIFVTFPSATRPLQKPILAVIPPLTFWMNNEPEAVETAIDTPPRQVFVSNNVEEEVEYLRKILELPAPRKFRRVGAEVVRRTPETWSRTLTLNRGTRAGFKPGTPLVSYARDGTVFVVGRVMESTATTSLALLLTDPRSRVSVYPDKNRNRAFIYRGSFPLLYTMRYHDLRVGDRLLTSGLDGVFPAGIEIGRITEVELVSSTETRVKTAARLLEEPVTVVFALIPMGREL